MKPSGWTSLNSPKNNKEMEGSSPPLPTAGRHKAGLPGNVDMITRSAVLPAGRPADLPVMER